VAATAAKTGRSVFSIVEGFVQDHKFKVGQSVSFTSGPFGRGRTNGIYKVTRLLPPEGDATEPHERVVKESQLNRVA
jgi:hypothetical protein